MRVVAVTDTLPQRRLLFSPQTPANGLQSHAKVISSGYPIGLS
jgi:hypothetical protein